MQARERELVAAAQGGSRAALAELLVPHQDWLFNLAVRMTGDRDDAADVVQEVLTRAIASLDSFRGESGLRTWLHRIAANHLTNMGKRRRELVFTSFERHRQIIDEAPDVDLGPGLSGAETEVLAAETRTQCMMGMLLCLDRAERMAFITALLGEDSASGSAMLGTSRDNYRQILSRARRQLTSFMNERCGLMREENPCRCARKTRAAIAAGYVDPERLQFATDHLRKVRDVAVQYAEKMDDLLQQRAEDLFREHPFLEAPDCLKHLRDVGAPPPPQRTALPSADREPR